MRYTSTEELLVVRQLRRAADEVVRAKLMCKAVASDEVDWEMVDDLLDMGCKLHAYATAIVKAPEVPPEEETSEEEP
jgi:hypothetical protein